MDLAAHDLEQLATHLIAQAEADPTGRAVQHVDLGHDTLRVMAIGFATGGALPEHDNPGEAVLQVLRGSLTLINDAVKPDAAAPEEPRVIEAKTGWLVRIPDARHHVEALEPSAMLLTQLPRNPPTPPA